MSSIATAVQGLAGTLVRKDFSTGSKGYFQGGKVADETSLYQAQVQAILVGSKGDPTKKVEATDEQIREAVKDFVSTSLLPKVFSSGQEGYHGQGKIAAGGQVFQVSAQAVKIR
jgi:hypothetical protein